jgi:hypothetical protein
MNDPPPSATARNRALPEAVDGVFQTALAKTQRSARRVARALVVPRAPRLG